MLKSPNRSARRASGPTGGFAETQFLHSAGEDDYSGFAPTEMFGDDEVAPLAAPVVSATATAARAAALAQAHEAAHQAQAVIAAQRHPEAAADAAPRTGLARLRAAVERLFDKT